MLIKDNTTMIWTIKVSYMWINVDFWEFLSLERGVFGGFLAVGASGGGGVQFPDLPIY